MIICGIFCLFLGACGPREIGQGTSSDYAEAHGVGGADAMRYPMTGASNTQKMLYYYNRPDVMQKTQNLRIDEFRRSMGLAPSPEDPEYRATPKQRSPFRQ